MATDTWDDIYGTDIEETETIAWQTRQWGAWSVTHKTTDRGVTTACGQQVPRSAWVTDSTSDTGGRCKRCFAVTRKGRR